MLLVQHPLRHHKHGEATVVVAKQRREYFGEVAGIVFFVVDAGEVGDIILPDRREALGAVFRAIYPGCLVLQKEGVALVYTLLVLISVLSLRAQGEQQSAGPALQDVGLGDASQAGVGLGPSAGHTRKDAGLANRGFVGDCVAASAGQAFEEGFREVGGAVVPPARPVEAPLDDLADYVAALVEGVELVGSALAHNLGVDTGETVHRRDGEVGAVGVREAVQHADSPVHEHVLGALAQAESVVEERALLADQAHLRGVRQARFAVGDYGEAPLVPELGAGQALRVEGRELQPAGGALRQRRVEDAAGTGEGDVHVPGETARAEHAAAQALARRAGEAAADAGPQGHIQAHAEGAGRDVVADLADEDHVGPDRKSVV